MNKTGLILVSHGDFAKAALSSSEMIAGKQSGVVALGLAEDSSLAMMEKWIKDAYDDLISTYEQVVILCDIYGGTPFNAINTNLIKGMDAIAFTGLSLPLVIDLLLSRDLSREDTIKKIEETSKIVCQQINVPKIIENEEVCDL